MATSSGYSPIIFDSFESWATRPSPEKVKQPQLLVAQNIWFVGDDVTIRPGLTFAFSGPDAAKDVTSLGHVMATDGTRHQLALDSGGNLFDEVAGAVGVTTAAYADIASAQHRAYLAFSDLKNGSAAPKVYYQYPTSSAGSFFFDPVGLAPNAAPPTAFLPLTDNVGDMQLGVRYCVVLFKTRTGYIGGYANAAKLKITITANGGSLKIDGIPIGPSNCVARILAFTQAGASSDGPYFAIELADFVDGLTHPKDAGGNNITATVVNDNTSSSILVSFPDEYLITGTDVTDFADKILLGSQKSVFYSKALDRMIWCGEDQDTFRVSDPSDFETYNGVNGLAQPGFGDEGSVQCAREFKNEVYLLKNNGGHRVVPTGTAPAEWNTPQQWNTVGPCGPRAVDTCNAFLAFAHKSGLYVFTGLSPEWVAYDVTGRMTDICWDNVNWTYEHLVYVMIDEDTKTVRVGVPMGQSTSVNIEFVVDYSRGWGGARWSYWNRAASHIKRVKRAITSPNPNTPTDNRVATSQILVASGAGNVFYEDPSSVTDGGAPIAETIRLAFTPYQGSPGIYQLGAIDVTATGVGEVLSTIYPLQNPGQAMDPVELAGGDASDRSMRFQGQNERWSIELSNGNVPGNWFTLQRVIFWVQLVWKVRTL